MTNSLEIQICPNQPTEIDRLKQERAALFRLGDALAD